MQAIILLTTITYWRKTCFECRKSEDLLIKQQTNFQKSTSESENNIIPQKIAIY